MSRRRFAQVEERSYGGLTIQSVLDFYGHQYRDRSSQMVPCLLHDDRHPSMSLNFDKQAWKCHSCGRGGGPLGLIMEKEGVTVDGARTFAANHGLATGSTGSGNESLRGSSRVKRNGGSVPAGPRTQQGDGGYVPSWRRR